MPLYPPQLIVGARMLYLDWLPAEPAAVAALLPAELRAAEGSPVFMNQYVVDDPSQTSSAGSPDGFGAYSLTYLGVDLAGLDLEDGTPGRWWTHYLNSSPNMIRYAEEHGVPASSGRTELELEGGALTATTFDGDVALIRTTARVDVGRPARATGQLRYLTRVEGELVSGRYPYVADLAESFEATSVEFLEPLHPLYALRPAKPLTVTFGFYSPSISFCYPGGEG
ncbi:MAG: hypothetical protein L0206_20820, partial [Actinobacteria bacterium]|nr:hypothetical protein [Actinomycetota bacterium]